MYKTVNPLFLISQTPMHAGSGDSLGIVDMPIQRERHTSFPKIEGSSFKGAIRQSVEQKAVLSVLKDSKETALKNLVLVNKLFGYDGSDLHKDITTDDLEKKFTYKVKGKKDEEKHTDFAGAFGFTDARLLLFPIKSMRGVFAWITCPKVLYQFEEDMKLANYKLPFAVNDLDIDENQALVDINSKLVIPNSKKVVLEEYAFNVKEDKDDHVTKLGKWLNETIFADAEKFIKAKIQTDIIILTNDDFKDFVNLSTEVITRTRIDNSTGTVQSGALFTEEYLPSETVMYSLVLAADEFTKNDDEGKRERQTQEKLITFFEEYLPKTIQIGGNATIGKGLTKTYFMKGGKNNG